MTMVRDIRKMNASTRMAEHYQEMYRQRRMAKRRQLAWRALNYVVAILIGAIIALAIHDAPAKIAATVLDAENTERW